MRRGKEIPAEYLTPILHDGLKIFRSAWEELNLERNEGANYVNVQRITREQIRGWLIDNDKLKDHAFPEELRAHIAALEAVFLPFERKRRQVQLNKARAKEGRGKGHGKRQP